MTLTEYQALRAQLIKTADAIEAAKRGGYTMGSADVLANFKRTAESANCTAEQALVVFMRKHFDAICAMLVRPDLPVSESPERRFADLLNYTSLAWALLQEREGTAYAGVTTTWMSAE